MTDHFGISANTKVLPIPIIRVEQNMKTLYLAIGLCMRYAIFIYVLGAMRLT